MDKFLIYQGIAAPLLRANIDTDIIIRVERFMYHPRGQLGPYCLEDWRYRADGSEDPKFVLNQPRYRGASILVTGPNFGCGSSREAAVWALWDMGVRCVIAPSFGDIFRENCFQIGLLPIRLDQATITGIVAEVAADRADASAVTTIDLAQQTIVLPSGRGIPFTIEPSRRRALMEGLDEIELTLLGKADIDCFQARDRGERPWIYQDTRDIKLGT